MTHLNACTAALPLSLGLASQATLLLCTQIGQPPPAGMRNPPETSTKRNWNTRRIDSKRKTPPGHLRLSPQEQESRSLTLAEAMQKDLFSDGHFVLFSQL